MKITKSLSQEEQTIVKNIQSLIKELLTATGAKTDDMTGQPVIEQPAQIGTKEEGIPGSDDDAHKDEMTDEEKAKKAKEEDEKKKKEAGVKKDQTNTPSDVATANDDAEARILDALSEVDEDNIDEVKKAILAVKEIALARKSNTRIQKSIIESPMTEAITELAKVVKAVVQKQEATETALVNVLEGLGITKEIAENVSKSEKEPIVSDDNVKTLAFIKSLMSEVKKSEDGAKPAEKGGTVLTQGEIVQKNLQGAMTGLFAQIPSRFGGQRK